MDVRVSIGNLGCRLRLTRSKFVYYFGILNRKALEDGERVARALGGAAQMTPNGQDFLRREFGARFLEGIDARFIVDDSRLEEILSIFECRDSTIYEIDAIREIMEELSTKELPIQDCPILSPAETGSIVTSFIKTVRPTDNRTMPRDLPGMRTVRLFNIFEIIVEAPVLMKILASPVIYTLTPEEQFRVSTGEEIFREEIGQKRGETVQTRIGGNIY